MLVSWESRYEADSSEYDWYLSAKQVCALIEPLAQPDEEILYVGCGTSKLGEELYSRGRRFITNIDTNKTVIRKLSQKYAHLSDMQFVEMDATKLPRELFGAFQLVIDKALLDYLLCEADASKASRYLSDVKRVLKPGGTFCCISHGIPDRRVEFIASAFQVSSRKVQIQHIPKPQVSGTDPGASPDFYLYMVRTDF
jgi:EEF1A lysine methyltransferase 4